MGELEGDWVPSLLGGLSPSRARDSANDSSLSPLDSVTPALPVPVPFFLTAAALTFLLPGGLSGRGKLFLVLLGGK